MPVRYEEQKMLDTYSQSLLFYDKPEIKLYNEAVKKYLLPLLLVSCSQIGIQPLTKIEKNQADIPGEVKTSSPSQSEAAPDSSPNETKKIIANSKKVTQYCDKVDRYFQKYRWGKSGCHNLQWNHVRDSHWGNPIVWYVHGKEERVKTHPEKTTMILCGVHGDEITPVKFCYDLLADLARDTINAEENLVVIAPLVTPDSFFRQRPTRTNGRGVDANRNFPTKDWKAKALRLWRSRYRSDKRRFPGINPMSEQETYFQVNLINRYRPSKIISVHAPLTLIDYDGPESSKNEGAQELLIQMSDKAGKYRINNYPFFPGSLGNWAGNERNIPTYTLELPNSDWTKTDLFYQTFKKAIHHAINHTLKDHSENKSKVTDSEEVSKENDKVL